MGLLHSPGTGLAARWEHSASAPDEKQTCPATAHLPGPHVRNALHVVHRVGAEREERPKFAGPDQGQRGWSAAAWRAKPAFSRAFATMNWSGWWPGMRRSASNAM